MTAERHEEAKRGDAANFALQQAKKTLADIEKEKDVRFLLALMYS